MYYQKKAYFIQLIILGVLPFVFGSQAAKRFSVGPTADWDYSTINDALAAQVPFTEDVILEVYMDPSGYNTKGIVEYSHLFGGYSFYITGVTDFPKAATYYVNDELEYEVPQCKTGVCRTTEYVKGTDIVARRVTQGASASGNQFYVKNHLGSTMFLTDATATTNTAEADYFPYGKKINLTTTPDHVTQTFTGKELDRYDESMGEGEDGEGWYYFGTRYYDADIGLWISTDPEEEYFSLYSYCGNDPINYFDNDGESSSKAIGYILKNFSELGKPLYTMKQAQSAVKSGHDVKMASSGLRNQLGRSLSNGSKPMKHTDGHLLKDGSRGEGHLHAKDHPAGWGHIFTGILSFLVNRTDPEFLALRKGILQIYGDFKINFENGQEVWTVGKDGTKINPADLSIGKGGVLVQKINPGQT
jgi:RHS repeat-associated protein